MAIAGNCIPAIKVYWKDGALHTIGGTTQVPVSVTYSQWRAGLGDLNDAAKALRDGKTVIVDARGGSYIDLLSILKGER